MLYAFFRVIPQHLNSDAGKLPRRKQTTFRRWWKFEIKSTSTLWGGNCKTHSTIRKTLHQENQTPHPPYSPPSPQRSQNSDTRELPRRKHTGIVLCSIKVSFTCVGTNLWPLEPITIYNTQNDVKLSFSLGVSALLEASKEELNL